MALTDAPRLKTRDLQILTGQQWTGTLTYLDYRSNKRVSIVSNLIVRQSKKDKRDWIFEYQYPDEPKANSQETVTISQDGRTINGERVIERGNLASDRLKIVTEKSGMDNDKKALVRYIYLISAKSFSIKKEVKYEGTEEYIERNQYEWKR
jgi:hypothetical protein